MTATGAGQHKPNLVAGALTPSAEAGQASDPPCKYAWALHTLLACLPETAVHVPCLHPERPAAAVPRTVLILLQMQDGGILHQGVRLARIRTIRPAFMHVLPLADVVQQVQIHVRPDLLAGTRQRFGNGRPWHTLQVQVSTAAWVPAPPSHWHAMTCLMSVALLLGHACMHALP
jgi:hypothetical protein